MIIFSEEKQKMKHISKLALLLLYIHSGFVISMELHSRDIQANQEIGIAHRGNEDGCSGGNLSPELHWNDIPQGTKSFAVTAFDPDVNTESGWWHWLLYDIPADVMSLARGAGNPELKLAPNKSIQGLTDLAEYGYHGVCPDVGSGTHHYRFTVYALNVASLDLPQKGIVMPAEVSYMINHHVIEKATITATFERKGQVKLSPSREITEKPPEPALADE